MKKCVLYALFSQTKTIRGCTRAFITGLQENFPSTVPTVMRTGGKLLPFTPGRCNIPPPEGNHSSLQSKCSLNDQARSRICALCSSNIDTEQPEASALKATEKSILLSTKNEIVETSCSPARCRADSDNGSSNNTLDVSLCYACRLTVRNVVSFVLNHILKQ